MEPLQPQRPEQPADTRIQTAKERSLATTADALAQLKREVETRRTRERHQFQKEFSAKLSSRDTGKRMEAAAVQVGFIPNRNHLLESAVLQGWRTLADDPDPRVQSVLVANLSFARRCPDLFESVLRSDDKQIQLAAIQDSLPFAFRPIETIVAQYLSSPHAAVRKAMIQRWRPSLGAAEEAIQTLADEDPAVRKTAKENPFRCWLEQPSLLRLYSRFASPYRS